MEIQLRLIRLATRSKWFFGGALAASIVGCALVLFQAELLTKVIANIFLYNIDPVTIGGQFQLLGIIVVLRVGAQVCADWFAKSGAVHLKTQIRQTLLEKFRLLGAVHNQSRPTGELTAVFLQGVDALDAYFSQYLPQIILAFTLPLMILFRVFPFDGLSGIIFLLSAPLIPIFMYLLASISTKLTSQQWQGLQKISAYFLDTLLGITTLKSFGKSRDEVLRIEHVAKKYHDTTLDVLRITFLSALIMEFISTISIALIAVQIGLRLLYGQMIFEQAFFILVIAPEFYLPLRNLGARFHASQLGVEAAREIYKVLDAVPLNSMKPGGGLAIDTIRMIDLDHVGFTYPGAAQSAIEKVTLHLERGRLYALVGTSGSGKSTLARLLLGLLPVSQGEIYIDGRPFSAISIESFQKRSTWIPQKPHLFNDTVEANIRLANPVASESEYFKALELARLDHWLEGMPEGDQTVIGENGRLVSSGEAQRIALGRAFLKNADFLILDEPVAHLDPQLESDLQSGLKALIPGKIVLIIAHRLSTVQNADQIFFFDKGTLAGQGTHRELLEWCEAYARMVQTYRGDL
ncbi:MAG TPA: thiol reductant ABC exporter subunit CydD [Anaerolineaceae bacterium]